MSIITTAERNKETIRRFHDAVSTGDEGGARGAASGLPRPPRRDRGRDRRRGQGRHQNTVTGTHRGEYMGVPPTGKSITYKEIIIARFSDGRIAETWAVVDVMSQMRQLGVLPGPNT